MFNKRYPFPRIYSRKCIARETRYIEIEGKKEPQGNYFTSKLPKMVTRFVGNIRRCTICDRRRKSFMPAVLSWSYFCSCMFNRDTEGFRARVHIRNTSAQIIHHESREVHRTHRCIPSELPTTRARELNTSPFVTGSGYQLPPSPFPNRHFETEL